VNRHICDKVYAISNLCAYFIRWAMDEKLVIERFREQKIITIDQLVKLLTCSVITARRRLKKWQTYTSINQNGRYYTLPQIPVFGANGLWRYQSVLFSKHGNLTQTIVALIQDSPRGLRATQIADILDLTPNSSFISRLKNGPGVKREKHQGRFVYFSDQNEIYNRQKDQWLVDLDSVDFPTDSQAIIILVQLIKHPAISIEQLARKVSKQDKQITYGAIRRLLQFHGLIKKTADTMR
jgi:hypothetical protein